MCGSTHVNAQTIRCTLFESMHDNAHAFYRQEVAWRDRRRWLNRSSDIAGEISCMSYEEEDTCMSYEEEDTSIPYEEDTCMSYEEEDTCMS